MSEPISALAQPAAEPELTAEDADELSFTLERRFADALGAVFAKDLHEIATSDSYGALKYQADPMQGPLLRTFSAAFVTPDPV